MPFGTEEPLTMEWVVWFVRVRIAGLFYALCKWANHIGELIDTEGGNSPISSEAFASWEEGLSWYRELFDFLGPQARQAQFLYDTGGMPAVERGCMTAEEMEEYYK